jgi:hypothetical protein
MEVPVTERQGMGGSVRMGGQWPFKGSVGWGWPSLVWVAKGHLRVRSGGVV